MYRHIYQGLIFVLVVVLFCLWSIIPLKEKITLGLDLKGGTLLQYRLDLSDIPQNSINAVVEEVKGNIYKRLDRFGLKEIEVRVVGLSSIQVAVPGVTGEEIKYIKEQISTAGKLTVRLVDQEKPNPSAEDIEDIQFQWEQYRSKIKKHKEKAHELGKELAGEAPKEPSRFAAVKYATKEGTSEPEIDPVTKKPKVEQWYILHNEDENILSGDFIEHAMSQFDQQTAQQVVLFTLQGTGPAHFENLTKNNLKKPLAIEMDGTIKSVATIQDVISGSGRITGGFTPKESESLANILSVGSLPAKPSLTQEQVIGSRLGQESIQRGQLAVIIGFMLVVIFMLFYYLKAGIVADCALFFNLLLILSYVVIFSQTLTFPGIAGVLLTVGMAVDANILIFERIREEMKKGKGLVPAIKAGYDRAFWTIFDANATTFITALVLFKVGKGPIQGFAITLMAGLVANFVTALYFSRLLLSVMHKIGLLKELKMLEAFGTPKIPFIKKRKTFMALSAVILACGIAVVAIRGNDCVGIDFRGGMETQVNLKNPVDLEAFRAMLVSTPEGQEEFSEAQIQAVGTSAEGATGFIIRVPIPEDEKGGNVAEAAAPETPPTTTPDAEPKTEAEKTAPAGDATPDKSTDTTAQPADTTPKTPEGTTPTTPPVTTPTTPPVTTPTSPANTTPTTPPVPPADIPAPKAATGFTLKDRCRAILKEVLAGSLAPAAFPKEEEKEHINPDRKINVLQVNLYKGDISHEALTKAEFGKSLQSFISQYIESRNQEDATASLSGQKLGKFDIAQVTLLPYNADQDAYITVEVATSPIKYGEKDAPRGHNEVMTALKAFFQSDFYKTSLDQLYQESLNTNTGTGDLNKVDDYTQLLPSEQFPRISMVDSAVAEEFQGSASLAILVSLLAIIFYIAIRFEFTFGLGAVAALIHDVLFGLGAMAVADYVFGSFFSVKIDLPVVAAFLTIIGYSLNDTIVVFDRIRENMKQSKKWVLEDLVNDSINQTLSRTIWTSLTTFVVVLVLLLYGGESVQGFSFVMLMGVLVGTYSSIFIASPTMIYFRRRHEAKREERIAAQQKGSKKK